MVSVFFFERDADRERFKCHRTSLTFFMKKQTLLIQGKPIDMAEMGDMVKSFMAVQWNYDDSSKEVPIPQMLHMFGDIRDGGLGEAKSDLIVSTHSW